MQSQNALLAALPKDVQDRLQQHAQVVELKDGDVIHRPGQSILAVYFPIDCLISVTVTTSDGRTVEAGVCGSREMAGVNAFMGGRETNQTEYICQCRGSAINIAADIFLLEFDQSKQVRNVMLRYTQAYIAQLSQNVACNRLHTIKQRFARWVLECRDRLKTDDLSITHEFISEMLGVRRAGISEIAAELQEAGLIEYGRKRLAITNPTGLQDISCECFRVILAEYDRLLGECH